MNGYICFYQNKTIEIYAESSYQAQQKAMAALKVSPKKAYLIYVNLAERDGQPVTHSTASL